MKIIIINKKSEFTTEQINSLNNLGHVVFIETKEELEKTNEFDSEEEKVIALDPGIVNWEFSNTQIDAIKNLKAICLPTTKCGWVDGKYLRTKGILLTNVPKYSTESVAEHCILLMLGLAKKLPLVINAGWKLDYAKHLGNETKGSTMGIVGLGDIGKRVAELGLGMGMSVNYWSRKTRDDRFTYKELDGLLKESDYIFLTISEAPETNKFLSQEKIDIMKKGSFVINISGDEVWDFEYLEQKVKNGSIAGIALDDDRRQMYSSGTNILITPHIAWYTKEAFEEDFRVWVESISSVITNNPINSANNNL